MYLQYALPEARTCKCTIRNGVEHRERHLREKYAQEL